MSLIFWGFWLTGLIIWGYVLVRLLIALVFWLYAMWLFSR